MCYLKWIKGYEGEFAAHKNGYILAYIELSRRKPPIQYKKCSPKIIGSFAKSYHKVSLKGKSYYTHKLIAETFIPNPNNYHIVNHKDGNKQNNHIDNLEWCTQSQNVKHAYASGLIRKKRLWV